MIRVVAVTILLFGLAYGMVEPSLTSENSTETEDSSEGRIVGGVDADIRLFPYQASVQVKHRTRYFHTCGGAILNPTTIISAAHCFHPVDGVRKYYIRVGSSVTQSGGQFVKVHNATLHPSYDPSGNNFDVAILKLSQSLEFNENVKPIMLDEGTTRYTQGVKGVISGWGTTMFQGNLAARLQTVTIPVVSKERCQIAYSAFGRITDQMMCAGRGGHDSCQGDSGGPLAINNRLAGIVSWGYECARPRFPGVYTRVAAVRTFIDHHV